MSPCFCGRASSGFAFIDFNPSIRDRRPTQHACSMACMHIIARNKGMAPSRDEQKAVGLASEEIGQYLDQLGKTDLAQMSGEEWEAFLGHAFVSIAARVREIVDEEIPF